MATKCVAGTKVRPDYKRFMYYLKDGHVWSFDKDLRKNKQLEACKCSMDMKKFMYYLKKGADGKLAVIQSVRIPRGPGKKKRRSSAKKRHRLSGGKVKRRSSAKGGKAKRRRSSCAGKSNFDCFADDKCRVSKNQYGDYCRTKRRRSSAKKSAGKKSRSRNRKKSARKKSARKKSASVAKKATSIQSRFKKDAQTDKILENQMKKMAKAKLLQRLRDRKKKSARKKSARKLNGNKPRRPMLFMGPAAAATATHNE
ncbi:hypothetical protein OAM67_00845 [bacterium]|nr:hypothetical protein [bacterium]